MVNLGVSSSLYKFDSACCLEETRDNKNYRTEQPTTLFKANGEEENAHGGVCLNYSKERLAASHTVPFDRKVFCVFLFHLGLASFRLLFASAHKSITFNRLLLI